MMTSFEDKYHNFAQHLRKHQMQFYPIEMLEEISDEDILESYRRDPKDESFHYTKEQEKSIIMECESNESIEKAFERLKHLKHSEDLEKNLIEEFRFFLKPIEISECAGIDVILSKLNKKGIKVEIKELNALIRNVISIFPYWVLKGSKSYVKEESPNTFCIDFDDYCPMCLLDETLHRYKTMFGWSNYELDSNFDKKYNEPETFDTRILNFVQDNIMMLFSKHINNVYPELELLLKKLFGKIMSYIMGLSLISCWVHGKEKALEEEKKNEESVEVLKQTHEYFCEKYRDCKKSENMDQFFIYVDNFLKPLSLDQLKILYKEGFPLDLDSKTLTRINRTIVKCMRKKEKNEI